MDIRYLLEAVKDSTGDICDSFSDHPKDDWQAAGLIERFEGYQDREPHKYVAGGLEIALSLHLAETQSCSH